MSTSKNTVWRNQMACGSDKTVLNLAYVSCFTLGQVNANPRVTSLVTLPDEGVLPKSDFVRKLNGLPICPQLNSPGVHQRGLVLIS